MSLGAAARVRGPAQCCSAPEGDSGEVLGVPPGAAARVRGLGWAYARAGVGSGAFGGEFEEGAADGAEVVAGGFYGEGEDGGFGHAGGDGYFEEVGLA